MYGKRGDEPNMGTHKTDCNKVCASQNSDETTAGIYTTHVADSIPTLRGNLTSEPTSNPVAMVTECTGDTVADCSKGGTDESSSEEEWVTPTCQQAYTDVQ